MRTISAAKVKMEASWQEIKDFAYSTLASAASGSAVAQAVDGAGSAADGAK
jgi:hypothetical protein